MKRYFSEMVFALLLAFAMALALCACGQTTPDMSDESAAPAPTEAPVNTEAPAGPQAESAPIPDDVSVGFGRIKGDLAGMTPEIARAYLAVVDDASAHLGYDEAEGLEDEYLHGGFVRDWDGDGVPELCLLLKTNQRDSDGWDGTPLFGWNPPALYLYTYRNGQVERVDERYLSSSSAGQETATIALAAESGMQYVWWERDYDPAGSSYYYILGCYELKNGAMLEIELPASLAESLQEAETAQDAVNVLGADKAQLLLFNNSGEAGIEGEANAKVLRETLAARAS